MEVAPGIFSIPIPVPFPLKFVNCYLGKGPDGWTLLDTGLGYPPAMAAWREAFQELGLTPRDITRIVVSHIHADHMGLARYFQDASGATVYLLDQEKHQAETWERGGGLGGEVLALFERNGMPPDLARDVVHTMEELRRLMGPAPERVETLAEGQEVPLGPVRFRAIWTPGHSDGHMCLYSVETGILLAADHVLPKITPNISLWPRCRPDPLGDYLRSLARVEGLEADRVLPGHGPLFRDLRGRVRELLAHHDQRLDLMRKAAGPGRTAFEVAQEVFRSDLTLHEARFAMAETLAHLEYLALRGELAKGTCDGTTYYFPA